ncbi:MAG: fasciclin, partial [Spirochaetae bacterium HGW-Spirochaetae-10]
LEYHVYVGGVQADYFTDGMVLNQANGKDVTIRLKDGKATVNGANIVASVKASNGVIHIVDGVLLPPSK